MTIVWLPRAVTDLRCALAHIRDQSQRSADRVGDRVVTAVERLADFPHLGRTGRIEETRELSVPRTKLIVAYRIDGDDVEILAVIHSARRWPDQL